MVIFKHETEPAAFELHRLEDTSGISGTGHVLDGVVFGDGTTVVRWRGKNRSTAVFKTYRQFEKIHMARHGSSEIKWVNGFNGLDFTCSYLENVGSQLSQIETSKENKYIVAKMHQLITSKVTELRGLRNGNTISITQNRGESQTSLSRTGVNTESITGASKSNDSITKKERG